MHPALFLVLGNLSRTDALIIDSLSSAFEHLIVSDVVRASISFPGFFTPKELLIWRDTETGSFATRETLSSKGQESFAHKSRETFVDGGVIANFPIWLLLQVVRDVLWGKGRSFGTTRLASNETFRVGIKVEEDDEPYNPLKDLAFRPMIHIGLQLTSVSNPPRLGTRPPLSSRFLRRAIHPDENLDVPWPAARRPEIYWNRLAQLLIGGARSRLEGLLLELSAAITKSRVHLCDQNINDSGWNRGVMDFHHLYPRKAAEMFDAGYLAAWRSYQGIQFHLPFDSDDDRSIVGILQNVNRRTKASIAALAQVDEGRYSVSSSIYLIHGAGGQTELTERLRLSSDVRLPATYRISLHVN